MFVISQNGMECHLFTEVCSSYALARKQMIRYTKRQVDMFYLAGVCEEISFTSSIAAVSAVAVERRGVHPADASTMGPMCCGRSGVNAHGA